MAQSAEKLSALRRFIQAADENWENDNDNNDEDYDWDHEYPDF
jgi:hypothetical protein